MENNPIIVQIASFLISKDLVFVNSSPMKFSELQSQMTKVASELHDKFGVGSHVKSKSTKTNGIIESSVSIPSTPKSSSESTAKPESKKTAVTTTAESKKDDSKEKVYSASNGGWLKAFSEIAKSIKDNSETPHADPIKISFRRGNKVIHIKSWICDIKAFAELYDKYGDKIKKQFEMNDKEFNGECLLDSAVHDPDHPMYTFPRVRARMFAVCTKKVDDDCMITCRLNNRYMEGESWTEAYEFPNRTCVSCYKKLIQNEYDENDNEDNEEDE